MRITHPRLANALHESTNIQTVLEKNDAASEHAGYRNPNLAMSCLKIAICRM